MGRTEIYACGESVSRRNSSESEVLFSLKQEAPASIGGGTFTGHELQDMEKSLQYTKWAVDVLKGEKIDPRK